MNYLNFKAFIGEPNIEFIMSDKKLYKPRFKSQQPIKPKIKIEARHDDREEDIVNDII